ncbi:MAG: hypothetical protein U1D55_09055 [Phycisphaerae bacterium]
MTIKAILSIWHEKAVRLKAARRGYPRECLENAIPKMERLIDRAERDLDYAAASIEFREIAALLGEARFWDE